MAKAPSTRNYPAIAAEYCRAVLSGEIAACKWVRLACQRQVDDLKRTDWEWHFDAEKASRVCRFIELLSHIKGKWKTPNIRLEPWQLFILCTVFGWVDKDGNRRFRTVYIEVPRKNAKSTLTSGVALYCLCEDEPGAEVYCLDSSTPVLCGDMRWRPVGEVVVGDKLVAFDEHAPRGREIERDVTVYADGRGHGRSVCGSFRKLREATVTSSDRIIQPRYRITFSDGRSVVASAGHLWLGKMAPIGDRKGWIRTDKLYPGSRIRDLGRPWDESRSYESGYLAGVFDGEGSFGGTGYRTGFRVAFAQKPGTVLDTTREYLSLGGYSPSPKRKHKSGVDTFEIGGAYECFRFLGNVRPVRLLNKAAQWYDGKAPCKCGYLTVASVEHLGEGEVVAIGTTTGTLFANGLFSHNSAATKKDQARIVFDVARRMVAKAPGLSRRFGLEVEKHRIFNEDRAAEFVPLSSDEDGLDGLNIHFASVDELHAHKSRAVWDVLDSATGSRTQPLIWAITTAGSNQQGVCYEQREYVCKVLSGRHEDERYWGIVFTIDLPTKDDQGNVIPGDDWRTEAAHRKANPNYGVSVLPADCMAALRKAMQSARSQNNHLTKRLNVWVNASEAYYNMEAWRTKCYRPVSLSDFEGQECFLALDLSSKTDIADKARIFRRMERDVIKGREIEQAHYYVFCEHYLPEDVLESDENLNTQQYTEWQKHLTLTPRCAIDYATIEDQVKEDLRRFDVRGVAYDPWNAEQMRQRLESEGAPMVENRMGAQTMSEPMKSSEALVLAGRLHHNGDPVLTWMMGNVIAKPDLIKDNVYPRKQKPENKIDGAVAVIMALGQAIRSNGDTGMELTFLK